MTTPVSGSMRSVPFEQSLDGATSSSISMSIAVGKIDLAGGAAANQLISGSAGLERQSDLNVNYKKPVGGESNLSLEGNMISFMPINAGAYPWSFKNEFNYSHVSHTETSCGDAES
ncbi:MAG: hypothetical protein MZV49_27535 [Rhodopseudomonas palustris]|nr:hypothetical protein [Rhodopseudomonas palustris]